MAPLSKDDPRVIGFNAYKKSEGYANTRNWALHKAHVDGSLWAAFCAGMEATTPTESSIACSKCGATDQGPLCTEPCPLSIVPDDEGLCERLREQTTDDGLGDPGDTNINPDGPEAADRILALTRTLADAEAEIAKQKAGWADAFRIAIHHEERANELDRTLADEHKRVGELESGGERLATVAFHLSQRAHLTVNERLSLNEARSDWDALSKPLNNKD